jgi:hypothetical protein
MGQTFEVSLSCNLPADTPQQVLDTLRYMMRTEDYEFGSPPAYPFFRISIHGGDGEWREMLRGHSIEPTPYIPGCFGCRLSQTYAAFGNSELRTGMVDNAFSFRVWHVDYMLDVYKMFLQWLAPYVDEMSDFVGYYKIDCEEPILLFFDRGKVLELRTKGETVALDLGG